MSATKIQFSLPGGASRRRFPGFKTACAARLLLLVLPAVAQAQFNYTTYSGTITITKYTGSGGAVTIPSTINGLPVTTIGPSAFSWCSSLTRVVIPDSVASIEQGAFNACYSLTSVTMGTGVVAIWDNAFFGCRSLLSIMIPDGVALIGDGAFAGCSHLFRVTIPNSVEIIGAGAFSGCNWLNEITVNALNASYSSVNGVLFDKKKTTVIQYPGGLTGGYTIPNSVTSITNSAFSCCRLTGLTIPNSVTNIGDWAFSLCSELTSVTIPNSVKFIGDEAFSSCGQLIEITVNALNASYSSLDGVLFDKKKTTVIQYPGGRTGGYTIPNCVTNIGNWAFRGCTELDSVTIPNSVKFIGDGAFADCSGLAGVYFQGNSPGVGYSLFSSTPATVYYLPGTTGWGVEFAERPAVLWNPVVRTGDASFGVRTNRFGFDVTGTTNILIVVEACTDLASPVWSPLKTNTLTGGVIYFSDPDWTNYPGRFYRVRSP